MHSSRLTNLLGMSLAASILFIAGCASEGGGNEGARCGGRAYDNVMFNTDQYDPQDRGRVASVLSESVDAEVDDDELRRIINVTGEANARRIADEFRSCMAG